MSVILFTRGTGSPVKVNEYGFEHSVESGRYFLTKDAAISADKVVAEAVELPVVEEALPEAEKSVEPEGHSLDPGQPAGAQKPQRATRKKRTSK